MLVYVVEDDALKARRLIDLLRSDWPLSKATVFASFQSGLRAIEAAVPDVVILDMTLPTYDRAPGKREGRLRPLGGYDLLRKIKRRGIKSNVIIVTQLDRFGEGEEEITFSEITQRCKSEFPDLFLGSVYYQQTSTEWAGKLSTLILSATGRRT